MKPLHIQNALNEIEAYVQQGFPEMDVCVHISMMPKQQATARPVLEIPDEIPEQLSKDIDLLALKNFLNNFVKKAGKEKALSVVKDYANGSVDPAEIPAEKYNDLVTEVMAICPDLKIVTFKKEGDE